MRDAAIHLRAFPEQRDLIDHAATMLGENRSDFMLEAACDKAQSVVLDPVFFRLDADKFRQFTELLDAPPAQGMQLERAASRKAMAFVQRAPGKRCSRPTSLNPPAE